MGFGSNEINDLIKKFDIKPIWTPFITTSSGHGWYKVKTVGFTVRYNGSTESVEGEERGVPIQYVSNINAGYHGSVIDTGSSTLSMPRKPSQEIMTAILKLVRQKITDQQKFEWTKDMTKNYDFFLEWNGKNTFDEKEWSLFNEKYIQYFPDIVMIWNKEENAQNLEFTIPVQRYLFFKSGHICLDLFGDTPSILVGSNVMINKFMIYDRENMKLGVANIDCDHLLLQENLDENTENIQNEQGQKEKESKPSILSLSSTKSPNMISTKMVSFDKNEVDKNKVDKNKVDKNKNKITKNEQKEHPLVIHHFSNYHHIYKYFALMAIFLFIMLCLYTMWRKKDNPKGSRSNVRYQAVKTIDPDFDGPANKKIHNHRRKKSVLRQDQNNINSEREQYDKSASSSASYLNAVTVNMDNTV